MYKRLSSDCFDIYCNEMFWTYHPPPTRETHKAPFRPRRNAHSFAQCIYSPWKTRFICPISLYDFFFFFLLFFFFLFFFSFFLPSVPYNHTSWHAHFWNSTLTQDWFSGLSTFFSTVLKQLASKLHSRLPALFPTALHKAEICILKYVSYSFYTLCKWLLRHWLSTSHKILRRLCNRRSFQLRFCLFCWSWKIQ